MGVVSGPDVWCVACDGAPPCDGCVRWSRTLQSAVEHAALPKMEFPEDDLSDLASGDDLADVERTISAQEIRRTRSRHVALTPDQLGHLQRLYARSTAGGEAEREWQISFAEMFCSIVEELYARWDEVAELRARVEEEI